MEKAFEELAGELEKLNGELSGLTCRLKAITDRAEVVAKHLKRNIPSRDADFETDFRAIGGDLTGLTNRLEDFWKKVSDTVRRCGVKNSGQGGYIGIREFSSRARETNRSIAEFASAFSYLQSCSKGLTMRLNWFVFETDIEILGKLSPKILFAVREIAKAVDEASGALHARPQELPPRPDSSGGDRK